jgi:hypothetical protein
MVGYFLAGVQDSKMYVSRILGEFLLKLLLSRLGDFWLEENN